MIKRTHIAMLLGASMLTACGAPTKSASDVAGLFQGSGVSLQEKTNALCNELAKRTQPPMTSDLNVDLGGCADAGKAAVNLKEIDSFYFQGLDKNPPSADKVIRTSARAEVWLNKSLLGLASGLSSMMKKKKGGNNTGVLSLPDGNAGGKGLQGLVTPTIEVIEEPQMNVEDLEFSMKIRLILTGIVEADHIIAIDGKLIDNAIAVTVKTTEDRPFELSILQNFQAVILIIPHASDVYMDLFVDLNVHDIGAKKLFEGQIQSFLGTGLKGVIDSTLNIK